jgi:hypothetical protein
LAAELSETDLPSAEMPKDQEIDGLRKLVGMQTAKLSTMTARAVTAERERDKAKHRAEIAELERDRLVHFIQTFERWWDAAYDEEREQLLAWLLAEVKSLRD